MGEFFTNVQVHVGQRPSDEARAAVVAAVRGFVLGQGFVEALPGEEPDRSVAVGPGGEPWIAVYDEATEDQDARKLDALAAAIARDLDAPVVSVLMHDGDDLRVALSYGGRLDVRTSGERRSPKPLRAGAGVDALRGALAGVGAGDAGTLLAGSAAALGLSLERCGTGYRYLREGAPPGLTTLGFRLLRRPAHEAKAEGPPAFLPGEHQPEVERSVGEPLDLITSAMSNGGASRGLRVVVWGDAIARGLVEADGVRITAGSGDRERAATAPLVEAGSPPSPLRVADFPDFDLPPGLAQLLSVAQAEPGQMERAVGAFMDMHVRATVAGRVLAPGRGELFVGYVALADPEAQVAHRLRIEVGEAPRLPLRAAPDTAAHLLRALSGRRTLFLVAGLGADRETSVRAATAAMERWSEVLAAGGAGHYDTWAVAPLSRGKKGRLKVEGFARSKRWREVREALLAGGDFSATLRTGSPEYPAGVGFSGLALATAPAPVPAPDPPVWLSLWLDTEGVPADRLAAAEGALGEIAAAVMDRAAGLQALRGRWGRMSFDNVFTTAYERASGVGGSCTMGRAWAERFLRGVTSDTVWLGPALLARIGDLAPVRAVADVTGAGAGVRVTLRDAAHIDALERGLAVLLPTYEDWRAGVLAEYAPPPAGGTAGE